ncbi:hypothetical protein [Fibrella forsythiae]|uniref:Uncharacterized protein n=1 Tax=Fibrella forsythiae TaxID=2817061 RepID=A0ABS3JDT7_9BACT|nr:hypothetical protein [Fibrella forsythiae]MBO0947042.1 hypothetical protein [Fibrella forsythiae]
MRTNQSSQEEVEKTLQSITGIERASPNPFFLTRVEARLAARRSAPGVTTPWAFRPVWVAASLGLALMLNVSAVMYAREALTQDDQEQETVSLSAEWGFDATVMDW